MDKNPKPVVTMSQSRTVNSAYFSPLTGNHVLTTGMDDFYRIYDFSDKKTAPVFKDLRHNNNTGRWVSGWFWNIYRVESNTIFLQPKCFRAGLYSIKGPICRCLIGGFVLLEDALLEGK